MQNKPPYSAVTAAEASSLRFEHRILSREPDSLIPASVSLAGIHEVLDANCGVGAWMLDVARAHPEIHIAGLNKNAEMVAMAREDAKLLEIDTVRFDVGSILNPLPYKNDTFDFIHVQQASGAIAPNRWSEVIAELTRVLRPGGWINLVDFEPAMSSSAAVDTFLALVRKALAKAGRSVSPDEYAITSAVLFPRFLSQAGYMNVHYTLHPIDLGHTNNPLNRAYVMATLSDTNRIPAFLVKMGVISQSEIEELNARMRQEVQQIDYLGAGMLISVLGYKAAQVQ